MPAPDRSSGSDVGDLRERAAALRQASRLPQAEAGTLLDAALAELDGAIEALAEANGGGTGSGGQGRALSSLHSERRLLHAVFTAAPLPLYVVDNDGTVLRANSAACEVLGVGPGYATGKSLTALIEPAARAAVRSQLAAVARTGKPARLTCGMLASAGVVRREMVIEPISVRGDADRLLVALSPVGDDAAGNGAATENTPTESPAVDNRDPPTRPAGRRRQAAARRREHQRIGAAPAVRQAAVRQPRHLGDRRCSPPRSAATALRRRSGRSGVVRASACGGNRRSRPWHRARPGARVRADPPAHPRGRRDGAWARAPTARRS